MHFTYGNMPGGILQQGDILKKDEKIAEIFEEVHPYFHRKSDYTHFIVLTQTCDLVPRKERKDKFKAKYISLAAVRPLYVVVDRKIAEFQNDLARAAKVCSEKHKEKIKNYLISLLNNNVDGYFYLEPDIQAGLPNPSCAFLSLSVPFKAELHYRNFVDARILCLNQVFQAKLGSQIGNMYSRVGTPDWVPDNLSSENFNTKVEKILAVRCEWVNERQLLQATRKSKEDKEVLEKSHSEIKNFIKTILIPPKNEIAVKAVFDVMKDHGVIIEQGKEGQIKTALINDPQFKEATK